MEPVGRTTPLENGGRDGPAIPDQVDDVGLRIEGVKKPEAEGISRSLPYEPRTVVIPAVPMRNIVEVRADSGGSILLCGPMVPGVRERTIPDGVSFVGFKGRG